MILRRSSLQQNAHRGHVRTHLSVSDDARFAIAEALIQPLDAGAAEDRDGVDEVDPMFLADSGAR
jgi:hypothetical protein